MKENLMSKKQIIVILLYLSPLLFFGYTADDRQHVLQHILMSERGIWDNIESIVNDVVNMQRFFPLHIILYSTSFKIFDYSNAWLYHALQICLNILAYRSFARWIKSYFNIKIDGVLLLIILTTIQFRVTYSDPIVSYFGLMQILTIAHFEGMICLKRYIEEGNKLNGIKWIILLMAQLLLYELTIFLMPITVFYLYVNRRLNYGRYLSACLSGVMIVVIYLMAYTSLKIRNDLNYSGTSISLSIEKIINTTIIEALGSLPLTYAGYIASQKLEMNGLLVWGIYIVVMAVIAIVILKGGKLNKDKLADLQLLKYGALIWVCSASSISLSERYQKELSLGLTYMVSYVQNFGYAMVVYYLTYEYKNKKILVGLCILTYIFNVILLNESNKIDGAKRIAMEILTDKNINEKFNYETLIINEKIMQEENEFKKNIGNHVKEILYIKVNELVAKNIKIKHENIGIAIVQTERYSRASMIVGGYDLAENEIYEANIFTTNRNVAEQESAKYNGIIRVIKNRENDNIYIVSVSNNVKIDGHIKGNFR